MPFTVLDSSTAAAAPVSTAGAPLTSVGETLASFEAAMVDDLQGRLDVGNTRIARAINKAYVNLCAMLDINELNGSVSYSLVASQPFYLVPANMAWIKWFGDEDSTDYLDGGRGFELIDDMTYRTLPDSSSINTASILPYRYFRYGRMVVIWPTPAAASTAAMDFRVRPASLVNPTDSPILPPEFHEPLFEMAKARLLRTIGMRSEGDRVFNDGVGALRVILNSDAAEKDAMHMSLQPIRARQQLYRGAL